MAILLHPDKPKGPRQIIAARIANMIGKNGKEDLEFAFEKVMHKLNQTSPDSTYSPDAMEARSNIQFYSDSSSSEAEYMRRVSLMAVILMLDDSSLSELDALVGKLTAESNS